MHACTVFTHVHTYPHSIRACIHTRIYLSIYIFIHTSGYSIHAYILVCLYMYTYLCMDIFMRVPTLYTWRHTCMHACLLSIYVCLFVRMLCTRTNMHIYIYNTTNIYAYVHRYIFMHVFMGDQTNLHSKHEHICTYLPY